MDLTGAILQQVFNGLVLGANYALMAMGLSFVFGILGVLNFAHGEFYMLGGYTAWLAVQPLGLPYWVGVLLAALIGMGAGMLVERVAVRPLLRADSHAPLISTFAVHILVANGVLLAFSADPRQIESPLTRVFQVGPVFMTAQKLTVIAATALIVLVAWAVLTHTRAGRMVRATAENREAAALVGVNVRWVYMLSVSIATGLAALAGALLSPTTLIFPTMGEVALLKGFVVVVLGGMGSLPGAILGGVLLGVVEALTAGFVTTHWVDLVGYIILVLVLLLRPSGLLGMKAH